MAPRTIVIPSAQLHQSSSQTSTPETCNETPDQEVTNTENNDTGDTCTKSKKGRGPALALKDWGKDGFQLELAFNEFIQVEGPNSGPFSSQLGIIARCGSRLPLEYETWRKVPKEKKEAVWTEIKMNTNAPEEYKENCLMKIGEIWKKWKSLVKKTYYVPNKDDPTTLLISPDRVRPEDWAKLVPRWQTKKSEDEAQRNKRNRQQYEFPHRAGKTSFANIRREMENKGEDVSRILTCSLKHVP